MLKKVLPIYQPATYLLIGVVILASCGSGSRLLGFAAALAVVLISALNTRLRLAAAQARSRMLYDTQTRYFGALTESILDLLNIRDGKPDGESYFNKRWTDYAGKSPSSEGFWEQAIHPDDLPNVKTQYEIGLQATRPFGFEYRIRRHDGVFRWHLCRGVPIKNDDGSVHKWVSISTDIHDQKSAVQEKETLLRELEEKTGFLAGVLEQMPSGVIIAGPGRRVILKNKKVIEYFSLDGNYEVGTLEGYHLDGRPFSREEWPVIRALDTGEVCEEEILIRDRSGNDRCFRFKAAPIFSSNPKIVAAVVIMDDVTEHKRMQSEAAKRVAGEQAAVEIKRSRELLEALFKNIPSMIFVKDTKDLSYLKLNRAGEELLGYSEEELLGKTPFDVFPLAEAERFSRSDRDAIDRNELLEIPRHEITTRHKGVRILYTKKFVLNPDPETRLLVGISHDITEIANNEMHMIQAREQAEQVAKMKSEFLANMSHEIRTPLNGVIGITDLMMGTDLNEQQRKFVSLVQDSGKALLTVVNDILDFSKAEAGRLELERVDFQLREFFKGQLEILQMRAKSKGLSFSCVFDAELPQWVSGDPGRLGQVLINLVGNAIKFTSQGGVTVRIIPIKRGADSVEIGFSVTDTGIGVSEFEQSRLFRPFEQGDGSTARRYGGTGLGLSISKKLVELMGGRISVKSEKDGGAVFSFTVSLSVVGKPLARLSEPQALANSPDAPQLGGGKNILVAEDNSTNQLLVVAILEKLGYVPHVVANGKEALDALKKNQYDLILMDCQMPELDGYEATLQIRELEKHSNRRIPIVALTANAMQEDRDRCYSVGMDDFVAKPIKRALLEAVLKNWTTRKLPEKGLP